MPTYARPCRMHWLMRWERTGVKWAGLSWHHSSAPWMNHHGHGEGTSLARRARAIPMAGCWYCLAVPAGAEKQTGVEEQFTKWILAVIIPQQEGTRVLCLLRICRVDSVQEQGPLIGHFHSLTASSDLRQQECVFWGRSGLIFPPTWLKWICWL